MKIFFLSLSLLTFGLISVSSVDARDLTYRAGVGYSQMGMYVVPENGTSANAQYVQMNGVLATYGIAQDLHAGVFFGFQNKLDMSAMGVVGRYDFQRLISRDASIWNHLNLFTQVAFLTKMGRKQEAGINLQVPNLGFEVLPFERNNFALATSFGLVIDFLKKNSITMTQGQFGDVSVRYYF